MNPFSQVENLFNNNVENRRWWWWWWFQSEGMQDLPFSRSNVDACEEDCKWGFSVLDVELDWVHIPCPWAALASSNFLATNSMCIGWCTLILCMCCMAGRAKRTGCRCAIWGSTASAEQWTIAFLLSQETTCWYQASKQKQVRLGFTVYGLSVCLSVYLLLLVGIAVEAVSTLHRKDTRSKVDSSMKMWASSLMHSPIFFEWWSQTNGGDQ